MMGVSGCFGAEAPANQTIDNVAEASATVDEIINDTVQGQESESMAPLLATHYVYMTRRVQLLTWAVVALAVVVLIKEL